MEEKKIVYQIIIDIWDMAKRYIFSPMGDEEWSAMSDEANIRSNRYRECNELIWHLYRDIYTAIEHYAQEKHKNGA